MTKTTDEDGHHEPNWRSEKGGCRQWSWNSFQWIFV